MNELVLGDNNSKCETINRESERRKVAEAFLANIEVRRHLSRFDEALPELRTYYWFLDAVGERGPRWEIAGETVCSHGVGREEDCERCNADAFERRYECMYRYFEWIANDCPEAVSYLAQQATERLLAFEHERRRPPSPHRQELAYALHRLTLNKSIYRMPRPWDFGHYLNARHIFQTSADDNRCNAVSSASSDSTRT